MARLAWATRRRHLRRDGPSASLEQDGQHRLENADSRRRPLLARGLGRSRLPHQLPGKREQRVLLCLDRRTGKMLWQRVVVTSKLERKHKLNSFASSTPATDGKHVYVVFLKQPDVIVACYDYDGGLVWSKSPGKFLSPHGFCSSPIL